MISITCNHCQTVLNIDDAFAGGVCRCQHCGTIQTVPSRLKPSARAAVPDAPVTSNSKTLYRKRTRGEGPPGGEGTGLDELAEVVASSGLSGSGLVSERLRKPTPKTARDATAPGAPIAPPPRHLLPIAAAVGLALIALIVLIVWLFMGPNNHRAMATDPSHAAPVDAEPTLAPTKSVSVGPNFCGLSLAEAPSVLYVLDRGNGTRDWFDTLKEVTFKSIESLGGDRKYQVIFWNNGSDEAYPSGLPAFARPESVATCRKALEDVTAFGQSDPIPALTKALASRPAVVILATGKSLELDSTLVDQILEMHATSKATKIDTFALGDSESPVLKEIASKTGGKYQVLSGSVLRGLAQ